jgi:hypothetical protein
MSTVMVLLFKRPLVRSPPAPERGRTGALRLSRATGVELEAEQHRRHHQVLGESHVARRDYADAAEEQQHDREDGMTADISTTRRRGMPR